MNEIKIWQFDDLKDEEKRYPKIFSKSSKCL